MGEGLLSMTIFATALLIGVEGGESAGAPFPATDASEAYAGEAVMLEWLVGVLRPFDKEMLLLLRARRRVWYEKMLDERPRPEAPLGGECCGSFDIIAIRRAWACQWVCAGESEEEERKEGWKRR